MTEQDQTNTRVQTFVGQEAALASAVEIGPEGQTAVYVTTDSRAFMRDAIGLPKEGVPETDAWPGITRRSVDTMRNGTLLREVTAGGAADDVIRDTLDRVDPAVTVSDVYLLPDVGATWGPYERAALERLAVDRGVSIHIGVRA